jgi:iron complex outermembrane recepter protein
MSKPSGDMVFKKSVLAAAVAATLSCSAANAQTEVPAPSDSAIAAPVTTPAPIQAPATPAAAMPIESVVVTGSRIARKDFIADSPITSVGADIITKNGPATVEATLNQLPQFSASSGGATQSGANQLARGARANLNLRGLGVARTLVLLDGKRLQPSDPFGHAVDMNTISHRHPR